MSEHTADRDRAIALWRDAYRRQMAGDLDGAIETYRRSIAVCPTAEAHTFLGWTYSFQGRLDEATAECLRAIEVDPDFGNPYNDIGVYLIQQDKLEEAVPWLERAKTAPRYEPRQFPHMNLARIHMKRGRWWDALRELETAKQLAPTDQQLARTLHSVRAKLNNEAQLRRQRSVTAAPGRSERWGVWGAISKPHFYWHRFRRCFRRASPRPSVDP